MKHCWTIKRSLKKRDTDSPLFTGTCFYSEMNYTGFVGDIELNWQQLLQCVQSGGSDVRLSVIVCTFHLHTYDSQI